jgi:hypothetical protein
MIVTLKEGPMDAVTRETNQASQVEFRDLEGYLVLFVRILRDGRTMLVSKKGEDDFDFNARQHRIPLHVNPQSVGGIVLG